MQSPLSFATPFALQSDFCEDTEYMYNKINIIAPCIRLKQVEPCAVFVENCDVLFRDFMSAIATTIFNYEG